MHTYIIYIHYTRTCIGYIHAYIQRRRLVINIGGQKLGSQIFGGQKFRENIFSDKILTKILEKILLFSKISDDVYFLHSKFTPFSLYFSFFVSVSAFFHFF